MSSRERVFAFVASFAAEHGYPPTVREISKAVNIATSAVHYHLVTLKADGKLSWEVRKPRTLRVVA